MRLCEREGFRIAAEADFCIVGTIDPDRTKPEGPFGDHLGYYSLRRSGFALEQVPEDHSVQPLEFVERIEPEPWSLVHWTASRQK